MAIRQTTISLSRWKGSSAREYELFNPLHQRGRFRFWSTVYKVRQFRFLQGELRKTAIQADQKPREDPNTRLVQILEAGKMNDHLSSKFHLII